MGATGLTGATGPTGPQGPQGVTGATGSFGGNLTANVNGQGYSISNVAAIATGNIDITGSGLAWSNASITQTSAADLSITGDGQVTVRSLDGTYQWTFDNAGNLTVPGNIVGADTIDIDNRASGNGADINLYSADDITIQARDRSAGSSSEGGDINIYAGDSAEDSDSSGGDIQIFAGNGGNANVDFAGLGGFITIAGGRGGNASTGVGNYPAEDGGELTLRAGDAGNNNGNILRGADGGAVLIEAGDSTGNTINGGGITLTTGLGGANALAGNVEINIPSSDLGAGGTWIFDGYGNLTLPLNGDLSLNNGGISQSSGDDLVIKAFDDNGILSSSVELDPNNTLTRVEQWSSQQSNTFTTADWSTGVYIAGGPGGAVQFTGAANIINFVNSLNGVGQIFFSVNGGPQLVWDGTSSGGGNITFDTPTPPDVDPTTVTSFEYFYSYKSGFEIDYDSNEVNIYANDAEIRLETTGQRDIIITSSRDATLLGDGAVGLTNYSNADGIYIKTDANGTLYQWQFDETGVLNVPGEGVVRSTDDTVTLQSFNTTTGNANSVYVGTAGGLGFNDQEIGGNWLEIFRTGTEPEIRTTVGNLLIQTSSNATPYNWTFGSTGNLTAPGNVSTTGNVTGGNILTGGLISATGNVSGGNLNVTGNIVDTGALSIITGSNGNISLAPNGTGIVTVSTDISVTGNITGNTAGFAIGYLNIPQVAFTANATIAATDAGKHYYSTLATANALTIANNTSVSWTVGTAITVVNRGSGNIIITQGSGVSLYLAGNSTPANRTVTTYGMATLLNVAANVWMINGTGVS